MRNIASISHHLPLPQSHQQKTDLFVAGIGAVGGTLVEQIRALPDTHQFNIIGLCNSKRVLWMDESGDKNFQTDLARGDTKNWDNILKKLEPKNGNELIFVDATGNHDVAELYLKLFDKGIHVVTPSKIANTRNQVYFDLLQRSAEENGVKFKYETNVGAGLPVLRTVRDLVKSGDDITAVNGVFSGTMTYIFSQLDAGKKFSEAVLNARQLGYAEPDPRDDLSGEDVARKMMILLRVSGKTIEREDVSVESIIPEELKDVDAGSFLERLSDYDAEWSEKLQDLHTSGKTIRYLAVMDSSGVKVGPNVISKDSPVARLQGTNNIIQIHTRRYSDQPLIIQGPGAGKEVTAAGVLADIRQIVTAGW